MGSPAIAHLATLLAARKLDQTLLDRRPVDPAEVLPSRIPAVDGSIGGGWRRGAVSEIIGGRSSGRTSVLMSSLAAATGQGDIVALVDAFDRFDPVTAVSFGLNLERVLWVRGTRLTIEDHQASQSRIPAPASLRTSRGPAGRTLVADAIHRAVRALDLIVRAGGFAIAALDVAGVAPRDLRELPWATWLRIAYANEGQRTACLLVGDAPMGRSPRGVSVRLAAGKRWSGSSLQSRRFDGFDVSVVDQLAEPEKENVWVSRRRPARAAWRP